VRHAQPRAYVVSAVLRDWPHGWHTQTPVSWHVHGRRARVFRLDVLSSSVALRFAVSSTLRETGKSRLAYSSHGRHSLVIVVNRSSGDFMHVRHSRRWRCRKAAEGGALATQFCEKKEEKSKSKSEEVLPPIALWGKKEKKQFIHDTRPANTAYTGRRDLARTRPLSPT